MWLASVDAMFACRSTSIVLTSYFLYLFFFFFFNDTATTEIYTLSLHDALPIWGPNPYPLGILALSLIASAYIGDERSEEHTSELQSRRDLVCRLLLEKKKKKKKTLLPRTITSIKDLWYLAQPITPHLISTTLIL